MITTSKLEYLTLVYDGTFDGFLTAVFYCFEKKAIPGNIISYQKHIQALWGVSEIIKTEIVKAERVWTGLNRILHPNSPIKLFKAFLSQEHLIEMHLYKFIKTTFDHKMDPSENFSDSSILTIEKTNKKINKEVHRMYAFVRFKKTIDDIFYAVIEPDFDILPLISRHFEKRYADQKWLIYDLKRSYGIYFDLITTTTVKLDTFNIEAESEEKTMSFLDLKEELYETLWKSYFNSVNIVERKNTKLQLRHMPKRYWKYLSEIKK